MKKYMILCAGLCAAMAFTSCKSSESAYKKAYEKAKAQEAAAVETNTEANVVAPVEEKPIDEVRVVDNADNVQVRQEQVSLIDGSGLKNFSVVVGSFSLRANADGLQQRLKEAGYDAQVVKNTDRNMFRVVATTFEDKASAAQSRNELRAKYPDAWLLFNAK
ncbi:MAG: SPOR domain-containing protein [Prevotella sp.]|nr:SPOR domain-containing protein [Prevotella sp.]MDD7029351.1 SPOR domain-containing protein [Prevotellaceae bacterium]MCI7580572.1 SPOR domain-containing protein [Prevotella sp.]MDD7076408.1 SPOR domain-containing protein [Prevotellaceae bacterium]MDY3252697.1 SPOR domain-containing protein [Prevotella sp.]